MAARPSPVSASASPPETPLPSWLVGLCGVAAVASLLFSLLLFFNV
jgi:hypothetical protein